MSPKTAYLKQTSEQRCKETFEREMASYIRALDNDEMSAIEFGWQQCWKYLEERLLKEIQS